MNHPIRAQFSRLGNDLVRLVLIQLLFLDVAQAATIRVPSEAPTILTGLDAATAGDTVLVAPGTYGGLEARDWGTACGFLKDGVVLKSEAGSSSTILDVNGQGGGTGTYYLVGVSFTSQDTAIEGFTFRGAEAGVQGIFIYMSELTTIRDCRFEDFDTGMEYEGAAIQLFQADTAMYNCVFLRCAGYWGSAITNMASDMWLDGCHVQECSGFDSAVQLYAASGARLLLAPSTLVVRNCVFLLNSGQGDCGALSVSSAWSSQIVENSTFIGNEGPYCGALMMFGVGIKQVRNCVFANNRVIDPSGSGGAIHSDRKLDIIGCTFWENSQANSSTGGAAVHGGRLRLQNNIFARNFGSEAVHAGYLELDGGCNDYWDNPEGNTSGVEPYPTDIFVDPLFCDPENDDWTLTMGSPCLPEGSGGCGLIGALGSGCGTVSVTPLSWGQIKGLYR